MTKRVCGYPISSMIATNIYISHFAIEQKLPIIILAPSPP